MKRFLPLFVFAVVSTSSFSQASNTWSVRFSDTIIKRYQPTIDAMTGKGWEYSNSIILHGMEKVYKWTNNVNYLNYIKTYIDTYLNTNGTFKATVSLTSLDRVHPGISVLFLYEQLKSNSSDSLKYRTAATNLRNVLVGGSMSYGSYRTPTKKMFWHKQSGYENVIMLDGMYMAHPFLAKYGRLFNDQDAIDTAVDQVLFTYYQLYTSGNKLIKHAWHEPGSALPASNPTWPDAAGNSTSVWSRAMGWYTMALVDLLKYVPANHARRGELLTALSNLAAGIKASQDPTSKLWFQVVDKNATSLSGNYIETSGSAMFIYTLKTAVDSGWIPSATYLPVAKSAWTAIQTYISKYTGAAINGVTGGPQINSFAPAMSVQNTEALYVQASLQGVSAPGTANPHGYAAILMAASAMEFPIVTLPVKFISLTAKEFPVKTTLSWQVGDETDVDHYEIQKSTSGKDFRTIGKVPVTGRTTYSFDDNTVETNTVYYRIDAVYQDNSPHYSTILSVQKENRAQTFEISPNPVKGGDLNTVMTNLQPGKYNISVTSAAGDKVYTTPLMISGETSGQHIQLPASIAKGVYYVRLSGAGVTINKNIIVE